MADGAISIDLILDDQTDKTWTEFKSKAEQQGKEGYDTFKKSFGNEPLIAKLEAKAETEGVDNFKKLLAEIPEEEQTELLAKAEKGEINSFDDLLKALPEETRTELQAKAHTADIRTFEDLLKEVPEDVRTQLQAKAEKGEIRSFDDLLAELPKETQTELKAKADRGEIASFNQILKTIPMSTKTKLLVDAQRNGIDDFDKLLKKLPKKTQTDLLAKAEKGEVIDYEGLLKKLPSKVITEIKLNDNASSGLTRVKSEVQEIKSKFANLRDVMLGTFAANALMNGIHAITSGIKDMTKAGMEYNKEQDTMKTVWTALTTEAPKDGKELVDYINNLSQHSIYAADNINKMAQSFYHVHSNVAETKKWTDAFVALGSTLHMTGPQISESGEMFAKIVAGGKASAEDMAVMINRFPMFGEALQKASGKSMKELYAMSAAGKLSAKQFTDALDYLGKKYQGGTSEAMTSMQGMSMYLKSRLSVLSGDVMKSSFNMSKSATEALQKITSDKSMQKFADGISGALSVALGGLSKLLTYISNHSKDIVGIIGNVKTIVGLFISGAWDVAKGTLVTIADVFGLINKNSKKAHDPLKTVNNALKGIADHKDAIKALGAALVAAFAVKKISDFVGGLRLVIENLRLATAAQETFDAAANANWISILVIALVGLAVGLVELYKHSKKFRDFVNGLVDAAGDFAKGVRKWLGEAINAVVDFAKSVGKWFSNAFKAIGDFFNGVIDFVKSDWKELLLLIVSPFAGAFALVYKHNDKFRNAVNNLVKDVVRFFKGIGKSIGNGVDAISDWFDGLIKGFKSGWNKFVKGVENLAKGFGKLMLYALALPVGIAIAITKPLVGPLKKIFNDLIKVIKSAWNGLTSFLKQIFAAEVRGMEVVWKGLTTVLKAIWSPVQKVWMSAWNAISKFFSNTWKAIAKGFTVYLNQVKNNLTTVLSFISKTWSKAWNAISDFFDDIWNGKHGIKRLFTDAINAVSSYLSKMMNSISKTWRKSWDAISDFFEDIWNSMKKFFGKIYDWFTSQISSMLKSIQKTWNKVWGAISDFFTDIWNGIKKTASNAWNWMSDKLSSFGTNVSKTWTNMWTGIRDFFSSIWGDIKGLAKDGMNGIIGFINTGVGGINGVIHDFGGKKQTIKPLKKLATGTAGAPSGLAMVNDGFDSPTGQELIIDNKGQGTILSGRNRLVNFEGGETVVPASVTEAMLGGHMFANGTDGWFGSVKSFFGDVADDIGDAISSATGKAKDFLGIAMHPVKYIEDKIFSPMTNGISNLAGSAISSLGSAVGGNSGVKGQQNNWWHELWKMLKDTMSGNGGSGGLGDDYQFKNKAKDDGADPWGYFFRECVSFVASRLSNIGVKPKLFSHLGNGSEWTSAHVKHKSTPSVGDIAVYSNGSKYGNHVSVVTGVKDGRYSEEGYNYAGNGKYYKSSGLKFGDATTFLNFGRSAARSKSETNKSGSPIQKLIRSQVGGMFDWVSDMMSSLLGSFNGGGDQAESGSAAPSGSHKNWLKQAGIHGDFDKWNYIINHESSWNPKAKNPGSSAYGIGQALPPSKMAAFGSDYMTNPITQLKWMKSYVNDRYGGIDHAYNFWRSHHWYANGGRTNGVGLVGEVDGEDEWVVNPNRRSADETILGSIKETADKQPNSFAAKLAQVVNTAKIGSQSTMIAQVPHGSRTQSVNQSNGGIDLSGDVHMVVQLDSGEVARATYPKIKILQNQDIQLKGQTTGNMYGY